MVAAAVAFRRDGWNKISAKRQRDGGGTGRDEAGAWPWGRQPPAITSLIAAVAQRPRSPTDARGRPSGLVSAPDGVDLHSSDPTLRSFILVSDDRVVT